MTNQLAVILVGILTLVIGLALSDLVLQSVQEADGPTVIWCVGDNVRAEWRTATQVYIPPPGTSSTSAVDRANLMGFSDDDLNCSGVVRDVLLLDVRWAGARAVRDLIPVVYFTVIVAIGIGLIGVGALGMMQRGRLVHWQLPR